LAELESLDKQIYRKQLELDILNEAVEIVKKDRGIDPRKLANREKAGLIDALRAKYPLNELLAMMDMPKSSYFYQREAQRRPEKYTALRAEMKRVFAENKNSYGYRRIHTVIKSKGLTISEKVVRRIMEEEQLVVPYKKKRRYSSYKGEITPAVDNLVARDFHAAKPNEKWLTDLTEFHIPAGKVYLSPVIDCFDGMAVSWTIGTSPDAELVNTMLDDAIGSLQYGERPIVHTDRGSHYRWPGWISRMEDAGLTRSMSKKGCSPDNSACEGFFGRTKNEMFYYRSWEGVSIAQFVDELDSYLRWYNEERIKMSLGGRSPKAYRQSIGLAA
jgi:transposase InsO family protein